MAKLRESVLGFDSLFAPVAAEKPKTKVYAVRQIRGPEPHEDLVIRAIGGSDAQRQWFCYYSLHMETYRYNLKVVIVPDDHPLASKAIECQHPKSQEEISWAKQYEQQFSTTEQMLKKVEVVQAG